MEKEEKRNGWIKIHQLFYLKKKEIYQHSRIQGVYDDNSSNGNITDIYSISCLLLTDLPIVRATCWEGAPVTST